MITSNSQSANIKGLLVGHMIKNRLALNFIYKSLLLFKLSTWYFIAKVYIIPLYRRCLAKTGFFYKVKVLWAWTHMQAHVCACSGMSTMHARSREGGYMGQTQVNPQLSYPPPTEIILLNSRTNNVLTMIQP